jgi:signal transduction histidine kinase
VLDPLSSLSSTSARLILALGLALALTLLAVSLAVDRTLAALLDRAQERERFIAAVTHELRTPLTSIRMYSEMLEAGMVPDAGRQRSYHQTIRSEAERLSRLVEQVLTLAHVEERGRESSLLVGERARLDTIVTGVVELLAPQAAARSLSVELELSEAAASVELPRDALAQILTNLVDNAIKFTPIAGEAVEIVATREADSLRVIVRDRGPGVDAALLSPMFQPFVRALREHEQATPGTGIGLAVVAALVAELGGRVQAHNREGGGLIIEVVI